MEKEFQQVVKCIVWDLDNTIWTGTLTEDSSVAVRPEIIEIIRLLDERGILHSIASRNSHDHAMNRLSELGISDYFLYPQINWGPKSDSISKIADSLNVGIDSLVFVDDQSFERDEVRFNLPEVLCVDAVDPQSVGWLRDVRPRFITDDSAKRRSMYQSDLRRNQVEESFAGPKEEFLASLKLRFSISRTTIDDLKRAEELTVRTNQLNTTGLTFSYDELHGFLQSPDHIFLVAGLDDCYGPYGKIGLALIETRDSSWKIKLLLMSCRVMARGVGNILVNFIRQKAKEAEVSLFADFIETDRNRMMYMTYKFNQFNETSRDDKSLILVNDLSVIPPVPKYIELNADELDFLHGQSGGLTG
ncbi:MAG: HAD-IIIC family phosphatase [Proteobacteria bacterium]|nr:HAD-IIIC family phosphatase [Pseudomonadota bacterium]